MQVGVAPWKGEAGSRWERAGRKDLGLPSRVWADLGGPGYSAVTAERGAERGCWALPGVQS